MRQSIQRGVVLLAFVLSSFAWQTRCEEPALTGKLETVNGIRVLTLTGSPKENGYARGYLLGREILDGMTTFFKLLAPKGVQYGPLAQRVLPALVRPPHIQQELEGLVEGMRAKLGDDALQMPAIGGKLTADSLWVFLTLPEMACSSFAAWGAMTPDGTVTLGRNLDYAGKEAAAATAILVVHKSSDPQRKSWVSPTHSLMAGITTGINEEGVFIAVHDSNQTGAPKPPANLRWFVLREFLEKASATPNLAEQATQLFRAHQLLRGTNLLICGPGSTPFIVEYDGNVALDRGVTIRPPDAGCDWIAVTNHFRLRTEPGECGRYKSLADVLQAMAAGKKKVAGLDDAWGLISRASVDATQLTFVYQTADRKMRFSFTDGKLPAQRVKPVEFSLDDLLPKKVPGR
jgi:hypothetical protein